MAMVAFQVLFTLAFLFHDGLCAIQLKQIAISKEPMNSPQIIVEWEDDLAASHTYQIIVTKIGWTVQSHLQIGSQWPTFETNQNRFSVPSLEFGAKYRVTLQRKNDPTNQIISKEVQIPAKLTPYIFENSVRVPVIANTLAKFVAILAYKLDARDDFTAIPPPSASTQNIKLLYYTPAALPKNMDVIIGDNGTSGPNNGYKNIPLQAGTRYCFTQHFNIAIGNGTVTNHYYEWSSPITAPSQTNDADGLSSEEIVGIIVGITAAIIGIVFIIICFFNWKYSLRYRPGPQKGKTIERLVTDPAIPITEDDFFDHVCQMKLHNFKGFYEEFSTIKKGEGQTSEAFRDPGNQHKNRYLNIPCYDDSRVVLQGGNHVNNYIHANFVPGTFNDKEYIYAQSPLPETIDDFWSMVWEQGAEIIVMIGQLVEKGTQNCAQYYPDDDDAFTSTYCEVTLTERHDIGDFTVRSLVLCKDGRKRAISHFQYCAWPTNKMTPEYTTSFLRMVRRISKAIPDRPGKPIVVHGTNDRHGRAGIYICVDSQIQRFQKSEDLSVYGCVVSCVKHRHEGVKTLDEYIFLHDAIAEAALLKSIDSVEVDKLPTYIENASKGHEGKDLFVAEFDFLTSAQMSSTQKMAVASQLCNTPKNRYSNIKPYDYNRVKLKKLKNQEGSDYINATFIDTYNSKRPFIAAQAPLVETIADFWRMIYEHKSWVIVMLGQEIEGGQLKANRFWPEEGHALKVGDLTVKFISISRDVIPEVWIRQMELMDEHGERKLIQFYQYQEWPTQKSINSQSIRSLIQLISQSESWRKRLNARHVSIISSSGIGRPGVLISLASLQEEADKEGSVDVFRQVQIFNQQRASLIQTREEYSLIYTATLEITENARRRPIVHEKVNSDRDDEDVGSTLGIDMTPVNTPSIPTTPPESEKQSDTEEPAESKKAPSVTFSVDEKDSESSSKKPLGRINTNNYDSKM